ncbi:TIR domain-containing protein [Lyngbya aestuarii]|uniref:TIR domain-containing protein n=1 Tax=Lyngbya aestuarii TaxID=118322 RepID=UPI00403DAAA7
MKDFFISYNSHDKQWAEWIAWTLEEAGCTVILQAWDFRPGGNFALDMQKAMTGTKQTIAVLSENYLRAKYTQSEWADAFARDPQGRERTLIPLRVGECQPQGLLKTTVYVDLVNLSPEEAETTLLAAFQERAKPTTKPTFPGSVISTEERAVPNPVQFPGEPITQQNFNTGVNQNSVTAKKYQNNYGVTDTLTPALSPNNQAINVFICYSEKDKKQLTKLDTNFSTFEKQGLVRIWHKGDIKGGQRPSDEINENLNSARIILLLVSPRFIADPSLESQRNQARKKEEAGEAMVIPILLSKVAFYDRQWFSEFQHLPRNGKPISGGGWSNQDEAFYTIAEEFGEIVDEITSR